MKKELKNPVDKNILERYAELKSVMKAAEKELKDLSPKVRSALESNDLDELETGVGKFAFTVVPIWKYPTRIAAMEEVLEKEKEVARQKGEATYEERRDLKFYPPKKDE